MCEAGLEIDPTSACGPSKLEARAKALRLIEIATGRMQRRAARVSRRRGCSNCRTECPYRDTRSIEWLLLPNMLRDAEGCSGRRRAALPTEGNPVFFDSIVTLAQALNLIGLFQCVFVLTLVFLKDADIGKAGPMVAFFAALGLSFALSATLQPRFAYGEVVEIWLAQAWLPTLSYLLILQAAIGRLPAARR